MKEEKISREAVMALLQKHGGEVAAVIIKHAQSETTTLFRCEDPVMLLPENLRGKLIFNKREGFRRAFERGYLAIENGKMVSRFSTPATLAYFLGRCFSNDRSLMLHNHRVWKKGDRPFPARALNALFGVRDLRELRRNHINDGFFEWTEEVDNLFITLR